MHGSEWEGRSVTTFSTPNLAQRVEASAITIIKSENNSALQ
jgi:hypothetical protein